ncbi:hypothetical protein BKA70DRAFT_1225389 [Coprinopsis sp. MPI-PUGE-AT-0042]|nr:hypothetical protein BKA70DRAFT_1225389 [Coprinopsis sp. MPI-PUGE-AT-0042]
MSLLHEDATQDDCHTREEMVGIDRPSFERKAVIGDRNKRLKYLSVFYRVEDNDNGSSGTSSIPKLFQPSPIAHIRRPVLLKAQLGLILADHGLASILFRATNPFRLNLRRQEPWGELPRLIHRGATGPTPYHERCHLMAALDIGNIAKFIRKEETKKLFECLEDRQSWAAFLGALDSPAICSACATAEPEVPCVTERHTIGCIRCFTTLDECSLVVDFRKAVLVNSFNHTPISAKAYLLELSNVETHLKSIGGGKRVPTWGEVEAIELRAHSGTEKLPDVLDHLRILHFRMQLEHIWLSKIVASWECTLLEISICSTDAIRKARAAGAGNLASAAMFKEAVWEIERMSRDALDADEAIGLSDEEPENA